MSKGLDNITVVTGGLDPDTVYLVRKARRKGLKPGLIVAADKRDITSEFLGCCVEFVMTKDALRTKGAKCERDVVMNGAPCYRITVECLEATQ